MDVLGCPESERLVVMLEGCYELLLHGYPLALVRAAAHPLPKSPALIAACALVRALPRHPPIMPAARQHRAHRSSRHDGGRRRKGSRKPRSRSSSSSDSSSGGYKAYRAERARAKQEAAYRTQGAALAEALNAPFDTLTAALGLAGIGGGPPFSHFPAAHGFPPAPHPHTMQHMAHMAQTMPVPHPQGPAVAPPPAHVSAAELVQAILAAAPHLAPAAAAPQRAGFAASAPSATPLPQACFAAQSSGPPPPQDGQSTPSVGEAAVAPPDAFLSRLQCALLGEALRGDTKLAPSMPEAAVTKTVMEALKKQACSKAAGDFLKRHGEENPRGLQERATKLVQLVRGL